MDKVIKQACKAWDGFNKETLKSVFETKKPLVTVVMVSWKREKKLLSALKRLQERTHIPLNLSLRVQECNNRGVQNGINNTTKGFIGKDIKFTPKNEGTGVPRQERLATALSVFDSPFVFFTDDDMVLPEYTIECLASILIDRPNMAGVNLWCAPKSWGWEIRKGVLGKRPAISPFDDKTVSVGSAATLMRREVFNEKCGIMIDNKYYIGCADIDLGLQITHSGWELGILALPGFKAENQKGGDKDYMKTRYNKHIIKKSVERFQNKWGWKL